MFDAIILLAGKGKRTGLPYNKVFHELNSKPLFRHSLEKFLELPSCRKVVLVCEKTEIAAVQALVSDPRIALTEGGSERQDSVRAGMEACESEVVLIHDGARPFVTGEEIEAVFRATLRSKAAAPGIRPRDTIAEAGEAYRTLDRNKLWTVLTPQGVYRNLYLEAWRLAAAEAYYGTDDISLLAKYLGIIPEIVPGSDKNIKVTTAEDLLFLEFLSRREA